MFDYFKDHLDPPGSERVYAIHYPVNEIKSMNIQPNEDSRAIAKLENEKVDEHLPSDESQKNKDSEETETVYVERRYCTVCNIEQPIRAKHCKQCKRCCASYDHHCPWLGKIIYRIMFDKNLMQELV